MSEESDQSTVWLPVLLGLGVIEVIETVAGAALSYWYGPIGPAVLVLDTLSWAQA